jgi:hypothetical protein
MKEKQFDPEIVDVFCREIEALKRIAGSQDASRSS